MQDLVLPHQCGLAIFQQRIEDSRKHNPQIQIYCFLNFFNKRFFLLFPGIKVFEMQLYRLS